MRSLNLDQLRAFVEVVAHGNFTAAAKELNLSSLRSRIKSRNWSAV